jgi:integral membrane sensor domain MASE1
VYGQPAPPEPKFWKALLVAALFIFPASMMMRALVRMTDVVWFALAIGASLAVASLVHMRVRDDWRAQYTMNLTRLEKRANVSRNVRIGR